MEASLRTLCGTIKRKFRDFQIHFVEQIFGSPGKVIHFGGHTNCHYCCKNWLLSSSATSAEREFCRRKSELNARPELREHLLAKKMQRWALIGMYPSAYPHCSPARARRNFSRLLAKYPHIAQRLRLTALSAYPPL